MNAGRSGGAVELIVFGSVFLEVVFGHVPALPRPGEEVFAEQFGISCGGAVTTACAAAEAGARVALGARLGEDLGSVAVAAHCRRAGVSLSCSQSVAGQCVGISVVTRSRAP